MRIIRVRFNRKEKFVILVLAVALVIGGGVSALFFGGTPVAANCKEDSSPSGLVGWWKLDGNTNDSSPYHDNGTNFSATTTSDRAGNTNCAYAFNGTGQRINIPANNALNTSVFTYTAWINLSATTSETIIGNTTFGGPQFRVNTGKLELLSETVTSIGTGTTTMSASTWYNVAVSYSSSGAYVFYVNGVAGGSGTNLVGFSFGQVEIGTRNNGSSESMSGSIDDVRMYNRVLSAAEIKSVANETNPGVSLASGENGLVGEWKMDGNAKDSTPYADNGTANNVTLTTDREGAANSAYSFNGSTSSIDLGNGPALGITGDMTITCWIFVNNYSTFNGILGKTNASGIPNPFDFYLNTSTGYPRFYRGNGSSNNVIQAASPVPTGSWQFVAVTMAGTTVQHYLNGATNGSGTLSTPTTNGSVDAFIGSRGDGVTRMNGKLDDVRLYNRALSAAEIAALYKSYNSQVSLSSLQSGEVGDWPLNGNARDNTPYGDNGTLTNSPTLTTDREGRANSAYNFNGTNQYILLGTPSTLAITGKITMAAWVKFSALPTGNNNFANIFGGGYDGANERYFLRYNSTTGGAGYVASSFDAGSYNGTNFDTSYSFTPTLGTWYFVVALYDGSNWTIYLNGSLVSSTARASGAFSSTANIALGCEYISGSPIRFLNGSIDDARIWNRALSAAEIAALYKEYR